MSSDSNLKPITLQQPLELQRSCMFYTRFCQDSTTTRCISFPMMRTSVGLALPADRRRLIL